MFKNNNHKLIRVKKKRGQNESGLCHNVSVQSGVGITIAYYYTEVVMKKILVPMLFLFLFLNSCSRLDIAVQFANTYVANKADDYFDLTSEQKKWLRANFEKDFLNVQKVIFPQLAAELMKASEVISTKKNIEVATVQMSYDRMKNLFFESLRMFSNNAINFSDKLGPDQILVFQKEFDKKMRDLSEDESSRNSFKKMKKQFDSWMGNLTAIQKKELENFNNLNPPLTSEKVHARQQLALEFVSSFPDKQNRRIFVSKITTKFDQLYESKLSKAYVVRNTRVMGLVASILNKISDDQRQSLVDTLRDRANQLIKISKS